MNRFRTKKKDRAEVPMPRPSVEETSGPFKMFGRAKKSNDEDRQEVDLASALPSSDDFRTSLLMTGLSARFSMLREQDDPSSKLGKASDDSVLFPRRQSRMDFGLGSGLHDIAEVESIRPPFARTDSFQSSDDNSSIMNRAKPTEGNNLFGGRQKIYKIPAGGTSKNGELPGRALYDDDVAQSAFQKWRLAEKDKGSSEEEDLTISSVDLDHSSDFSRRRETNSTTSSAPRNSTAATSINSQTGVSAKEGPSSAAVPSGSNGSTALERNVTRTRRLYEQGLNQDLHDQQNSAVSRMDTVSRQRPLAARMADLGSKISSPNLNAQPDRLFDRRPIPNKASAPNLRSFSRPTAGPTFSAPSESTPRFPNQEPKASHTASPPLSPPLSESEHYPSLSIGPNDRGKATAMGVFSRPTQQYDESRYAQRQRQLQQGRETPTSRFRAESDASNPTSRSRSSSSAQRVPSEKSEIGPLKSEPTIEGDAPRPNPTLHVTVERPDDHDHPAFRQSALPTPLSFVSRPSNEPSPISEMNGGLSPDPTNAQMPSDSPTLGPPAGLSGMVRQHLRNVSTASSEYGNEHQDFGPDVSVLDDIPDPDSLPRASIDTNDWGLSEAEWHGSNAAEQPSQPVPMGVTGGEMDAAEHDDFARELAEGARRVREKLTSYADTGSGRSTPPGLSYSDLGRNPTPPHSSPGMLKNKSSKGSLAERGRDHSSGLTKLTSFRVKSSSRGTSPAATRKQDAGEEPRTSTGENPLESKTNEEEKEPIHAGLRAFRQARRELQRMKQAETQDRHNVPSSPPQGPPPPPPPAPSRAPPPPSFEQGPAGDRMNARSRSGSRHFNDRARSDSEGSHGAFSPPPHQPRSIRMPYEDGRNSPIGSSGPRSATMPMNEHQRMPAMRTLSENPRLVSASSTPNLKGISSAPPLPPINPRRKTPQGRMARRSDDADGMGPPSMPISPERNGRFSDPDYTEQVRGRGFRVSPPRSVPRPPPQNSHASHGLRGDFPGGMI